MSNKLQMGFTRHSSLIATVMVLGSFATRKVFHSCDINSHSLPKWMNSSGWSILSLSVDALFFSCFARQLFGSRGFSFSPWCLHTQVSSLAVLVRLQQVLSSGASALIRFFHDCDNDCVLLGFFDGFYFLHWF